MTTTPSHPTPRAFGRILETVMDRLGVLFLLALGISTAGATLLVGL